MTILWSHLRTTKVHIILILYLSCYFPIKFYHANNYYCHKLILFMNQPSLGGPKYHRASYFCLVQISANFLLMYTSIKIKTVNINMYLISTFLLDIVCNGKLK